jgi:hypothetical protein
MFQSLFFLQQQPLDQPLDSKKWFSSNYSLPGRRLPKKEENILRW